MPPSAKMTGDVFINQTSADIGRVRQTSSYVEQQDHLIGSITTSETLKFAAKLGLSE
jgi:ABC-type multidrug transport system ATPase subunit